MMGMGDFASATNWQELEQGLEPPGRKQYNELLFERGMKQKKDVPQGSSSEAEEAGLSCLV